MVITKTAVTETAVPILVTQSVTVRAFHIFNGGNAAAYVQMFNAPTAASVTVGTTVPDIVIGNATVQGRELSGLQWLFPLGLVIAAATTSTGNTGPNAAQLVVLDVD